MRQRARADDARRFRDLARHQHGIAECAGADGDVDLLGDEVDLAVRYVELDGDVGIAVEEDGQRRTEDLLGDGGADTDPEVTARPFARRHDLGFRGLDRRQDIAAPRHEQFTLGGEGELSRGPGQQADAEPVLDPAHELGECRWRQAKVCGGRSKAAALDHPDEGVHFRGS